MFEEGMAEKLDIYTIEQESPYGPDDFKDEKIKLADLKKELALAWWSEKAWINDIYNQMMSSVETKVAELNDNTELAMWDLDSELIELVQVLFPPASANNRIFWTFYTNSVVFSSGWVNKLIIDGNYSRISVINAFKPAYEKLLSDKLKDTAAETTIMKKELEKDDSWIVDELLWISDLDEHFKTLVKKSSPDVSSPNSSQKKDALVTLISSYDQKTATGFEEKIYVKFKELIQTWISTQLKDLSLKIKDEDVKASTKWWNAVSWWLAAWASIPWLWVFSWFLLKMWTKYINSWKESALGIRKTIWNLVDSVKDWVSPTEIVEWINEYTKVEWEWFITSAISESVKSVTQTPTDSPPKTA